MNISNNLIPEWQAMKTHASCASTYAPGEIIFREGDTASRAYIIEKGRVEVSICRQGKKLVLTEYVSGDLFGEMALIDETTRSATVTALETTEVIIIDRSQFEKAFDKSHPLVTLFMHTMLHNLRETNQLLLNTTSTRDFAAKPERQSSKYQSARQETVIQMKAENELSRALHSREFELYFQPIINTGDGRICGFESLVRWRHPVRGLLTPDKFIHLAEQSGFITQLGEWIIDDACGHLSRMINELPELLTDTPDFFLTVNLSAQQLLSPDLFSRVMASLVRHGLTSNNIKFEITEHILMDDPEAALTVLEKLRHHGFRIAIDDFGTGYSSLSYLHTFPIDTLKIDRSFVNSIQTNTASLNIVNAIINLAKTLGLTVVAEGFEVKQQLAKLENLDCDYVQGYYFHRPMPFNKALALLKQHRPTPGAETGCPTRNPSAVPPADKYSAKTPGL